MRKMGQHLHHVLPIFWSKLQVCVGNFLSYPHKCNFKMTDYKFTKECEANLHHLHQVHLVMVQKFYTWMSYNAKMVWARIWFIYVGHKWQRKNPIDGGDTEMIKQVEQEHLLCIYTFLFKIFCLLLTYRLFWFVCVCYSPFASSPSHECHK